MLNDGIDVNTEDFNANNEMFEEYHITNVNQQEIQDVINKQKALHNDKLEIEIYAPRYTEISDPVVYYYAYNGKNYKMQEQIIAYRNVRIGDLEDEKLTQRGVGALDAAKGLAEIAIEVKVEGTKFDWIKNWISVVGAAQSAYDLYKAIFGEVHTGSSGDYIKLDIYYHRLQKTTSVYSEALKAFQAGCISHKVWLDCSLIKQFYSRSNEPEQAIETSINKTIYSDSFNEPDVRAIMYAGDTTTYRDAYFRTTVWGNRVEFSGT